MKINGFGKRFLSLLLAVVALVGLLSVGAMAEGTAPSVTLEVKNVQRSGDEVTAEIWATGTADGKALDTTTGIVMCSVQLDIPSGLELTKITKNADAIANDEITYQPTDLDEGLIVLNAATTKKDADGNKLFVAWTGGLVARLTFSIKDGAFGEQTIGFADTDGTSVAYGVGNESYMFALEKKTGSIKLPSVKLTFISSKGTAPAPQEMAKGSKPSVPSPAPTEAGYKFDAWYANEVCTTLYDFDKALEADEYAYAKWTANPYTVTFDLAGGTLPTGAANTMTVTFDGKYNELPTPSREGYNFDGWYLGTTKITADSTVATAENHTLTAGWVEKGRISFNENAQTYTYDNTAKSFVLTDVTDNLVGFTVKYRVAGSTGEYTMDSVKDAGTYDVKVTRPADADYKAVNKELPGKLVVNKAEVEEPEESTATYTWTGSKQEYAYAVPAESAEYYVNTAQSTLEGTAAGTVLKVTYVLNDAKNYQWKTRKDSAPLTYSTTIQKLQVTDPVADTTEFEYDGTLKTYTVAANANYTVTNNTRTNAGTQKVKIELKDPANTVWKTKGDSTAIDYDFTIAKKTLEKPTAKKTTFTYNETKQKLELNDTTYSDLYTLSDNEQKDVDSYNAKVTLNDPDNYCWKGETGASFLIPFSITKADRSAPVIDSSKDVTNETIYKKADGEISKVDDTMEYKLEGADSWTAITGNKLTGLAAGKYDIRYKENDNYKASSAIGLTVAEGRKLTVTFHTAGGSTVDPQTNLGYGDPVAKPDPAPDHTGFTLVGWYKDLDCENAWDFAIDRVKDDTDLYVKWEVSIGIEGGASFTEGKAPAEGVKIIVGKGLDQSDTPTLDLKKVTVDGKKLDAENYTAVYDKNGLTITLKQEYLNTLEDDEYEIGVVADSEHLGEGRKLAVTLTVEPEQTAAGKPAGKPGKAVKTGDSSDLLLWSILSLGAGAGLVCIGKKRREN